ncbi:zinc-dependent metalloprotease, partial [Mycolicibacter sinensis]|uniref:zinc-dependent metalloprotease n=1 Tax=Mycolicibacter sinensis (strain JDM601) TaxID=875328 RepID=UPI000A86CFCA
MTELDIGRAVDWGFAATVGSWLARPAPPMTDYTREQVIGDLHRSAAAAEPLVREVTGLGVGGPVPEARVLDRPQWIAAAAESMRLMTGGTEKSVGFISGRLAGAQTGALLAFVSSGILGQYDP